MASSVWKYYWAQQMVEEFGVEACGIALGVFIGGMLLLFGFVALWRLMTA